MIHTLTACVMTKDYLHMIPLTKTGTVRVSAEPDKWMAGKIEGNFKLSRTCCLFSELVPRGKALTWCINLNAKAQGK
jgi:hypothetical protein